jgi:hypothetical protein
MAERYFLYIDILGFKDLVRSKFDLVNLYQRIDRMNVHTDKDFTSIMFSDTIVVYGADGWLKHPNQALMWLIEFAQDLFYNLISLDVHIRAYITKGDFEHYKLKNVDAYYGNALIECYEREKTIKCTGVFLDSRLAPLSDIFYVTKYDERSHFVHIMQHLDDVSWPYDQYPDSGKQLEATGMEWWTAYLLRYLENIHKHSNDPLLDTAARLKYKNAWKMIESRHDGLCRRLLEANFDFEKVIQIDWSEKLRRIGTCDGAFA